MSKTLLEGKKILHEEAQALIKASEFLDEKFSDAVNKIFACRGRVIISGMGKSGLIGRKIAATLASTGTPSFFVHPGEAIHGDLGMFVDGDIAILISNSGETDELLNIIPILKRIGIYIISICGKNDSSLSKLSDIQIFSGVDKEICPLGLTPTASTTVTIAIGDAIAVCLLNLRKFNSSNYALFHPGGSLGRRLLLKVSDLMHKGDSIPLVSSDVSLCDVVYTISKKCLGCVGVVDASNSLIGIITDGDLRRGLEKKLDIYSMYAKDLISSIPKTVNEDSLAVESLVLMKENYITVLFVLNNYKEIVGIIHMHDLLRAKIY